MSHFHDLNLQKHQKSSTIQKWEDADDEQLERKLLKEVPSLWKNHNRQEQ